MNRRTFLKVLRKKDLKVLGTCEVHPLYGSQITVRNPDTGDDIRFYIDIVFGEWNGKEFEVKEWRYLANNIEEARYLKGFKENE